MAKLSELIPAMAEVLGIPVSTADAYAKPLRKDGLIASGGRGTGAPDMTAKDSINLLLAIMSGSTTRASENVHHLRNLIVDDGCIGGSAYVIKSLELGRKHTFSDFMECLICESMTGSVQNTLKDALSFGLGWKADEIHKYDCLLKVVVEEESMTGSIQVDLDGGGNNIRVQPTFIRYFPKDYFKGNMGSISRKGDMCTRRFVTEWTLNEIIRVLRK